VIIRRISDNAIHGEPSPNVSTVWNGLSIINGSLIENSNRFHVAGTGDANNEGMVRILGIRGTVTVTNSTLQDGAEMIDFFVTAGTLNMTVTGSDFLRAYKEFTSGPLASVGNHCLDVTVQGAANANVIVGSPTTPRPDNEFLNCRLGSVRVITDAAATGVVNATIARNNFTVNDHSSGVGGDFDFPQGGVLVGAVPAASDSQQVNALIADNYFDEVTNASGGVGQVTLAMASGAWQAKVSGNTFDTPGNAPWFLRADSTTSARVLFENNTYVRGFFACPDPACDSDPGPAHSGGYFGPGLRTLADVQNGAVIDLTINNDDFAEHDAGFDPGETFEARVLPVGSGGTMNLYLLNNTSPDGYSLEEQAGSLSIYQPGGSGSCTNVAPGNCQAALSANNNTGGGNNPATTPPFVNVVVVAAQVVSIVNVQPAVPSGGIFP
jgi:hypothetical protein